MSLFQGLYTESNSTEKQLLLDKKEETFKAINHLSKVTQNCGIADAIDRNLETFPMDIVKNTLSVTSKMENEIGQVTSKAESVAKSLKIAEDALIILKQ
ncbi:hypothetical protein HDV02_004577 [Globomyces sp. JEL0801]|nr:hypothetical protein HDV02_004577 [Globomyces sp. JEL0801]